MIRSVISIPAPNSKKQAADGNSKAFSTEASSSDTAKEKCALKAADSKKSKPGGLDPAAPGLLNVAQKNEDVKKSAFVGKQAPHDQQASTNRNTVEVTSINGISKMKWPAETVKKTIQEPTIAYSCNPSLCDPGITLSAEEEKLRSDLFIVCDLLDEMVDFISLKDHRKRKHHHSASRVSENHKKRRAKEGSITGLNQAESNNVEGDVGTQKAETSKKRKKSKKHRKKRSEQKLNLFSPSTVEHKSNIPIEKDASIVVPISSTEVAEKIASPSDTKGAQNKMPKKSKKSTKKKAAAADGAMPSQEAIATQSPCKKLKLVKAEDSKMASEASQQRIKIAFTQSSNKPAIPTSQKSKWDTSSDEEGSTRKGAISYKFSDESDAEKKSESPQRLPEPKDPKMMPFGKMQPGGLLKTIELHNPLPDIKSSGPSAENVEARSRSRSYSESRSRSRSSSYSYSSDDSYDHHRRKRRSRRRSYSRSYSRSRSHSYSSYSRSRSRSYSRSYSRSSSRSRYRSSSRSSYSSYSSYSSRSPSSSHRYTRAILPKYGTRAFKIGKRKKFKKNKQLKGSQQPNYNAAIMKQLETGRAKAEETVMRLKKQKEEQEQLQSRAMASIAAAASSAGITLPTTTSTTTSTAKSFVSPTGTVPSGTVSIPSTSVQNGDLLDSFTQASQLAKVPVFLPRKVKPEFIGPMRPGVDTDCEIPLPSGTPNILNPIEGASPTYIQEDPLPMQAPDTEDPMYKTLQEQVAKHMMSGNSVSPGTEHLHQQLAAQYLPMQMAEGQIIIDPLTGQPLHVPAAMHAHAAQLQQQHFAAMVAAQHSSTPQVEMQEQEDKPAPHEAVVRSYADQVIMSNHKALVSQTQPVFTLAPLAQNIPQAGVPLQASPFMVNAMQMQLQAQQLQQAQLQAMQAAQLQNLQLQAALGLMHPHLGLVQPGLPILAQQQLMPASPQLIQLPNGQLVQLGQTPNIFLHRFTRPM